MYRERRLKAIGKNYKESSDEEPDREQQGRWEEDARNEKGSQSDKDEYHPSSEEEVTDEEEEEEEEYEGGLKGMCSRAITSYPMPTRIEYEDEKPDERNASTIEDGITESQSLREESSGKPRERTDDRNTREEGGNDEPILINLEEEEEEDEDEEEDQQKQERFVKRMNEKGKEVKESEIEVLRMEERMNEILVEKNSQLMRKAMDLYKQVKIMRKERQRLIRECN